MKLLHLKTRFRMSKDNVPLFSQPKARKLSRDFKVKVGASVSVGIILIAAIAD